MYFRYTDKIAKERHVLKASRVFSCAWRPRVFGCLMLLNKYFSGSLTQANRQPWQPLSTRISGPLNPTTKIKPRSCCRRSPILSLTGTRADGSGDLWSFLCFMESIVVSYCACVCVCVRAWERARERKTYMCQEEVVGFMRASFVSFNLTL